jgi:hypothetical protein
MNPNIALYNEILRAIDELDISEWIVLDELPTLDDLVVIAGA